ncbi:MAG: outer membrane protein [Bacteroidia bacterium]
MKTSFFAFVLTLLFILPTQAQENQPQKRLPAYNNDLSLSFTLVQAVKNPFWAVVPNPRIMYRRHLGAFAIRAQAEALQYDRDFGTRKQAENEYAFQRSLSAMLGGQYTLEAGRFGLYGFLDVGFGQINLNAVTVSRWTFSEYEEIRGIKGQAGIGLEYRFAKRWHLGLESAATYIYGNAISSPGGVDVFDRIAVQYHDGRAGQWIINPVNAFWIGYSFGEKK